MKKCNSKRGQKSHFREVAGVVGQGRSKKGIRLGNGKLRTKEGKAGGVGSTWL